MGRAAPAHANSLGLERHVEEFVAECFIARDHAQGLSVDHQHVSRGQTLVLRYLLLYGPRLRLTGDHLDLLVSSLETCRDGNTLRCFNLVASEHPDLNTGLSQHVHSLKHILLKLILDTCHRQKLHIVLKAHYCLVDFLFTIDHAGSCLLQTIREFEVFVFRDQLLRDDQRPETIS